MVKILVLVLSVVTIISCSRINIGSTFEKALGMPVPSGNEIVEEHRVINDKGLFSTYYSKIHSESDEAFLRLVNELGAKDSTSVRSLPLPPANGMDWWLDSSKMPELVMAKRYLAESPRGFIGIIRFENYTYLWMQGDSAYH